MTEFMLTDNPIDSNEISPFEKKSHYNFRTA